MAAVRQGCELRQLAPLAVFANAMHEGLNGHVGEHGRAYGPWQLDVDAGLPMQWARMEAYSQDAQDWAWSVAGIGFVLGLLADQGARGLVHEAATRKIALILNSGQVTADDMAARVETFRNLHARGVAVWAYLRALSGGPTVAAPAPQVEAHPTPIVRPRRSNAAWQALLHVYARVTPTRCHDVIRIANRLPREVHHPAARHPALYPASSAPVNALVSYDDPEEYNL